MLSPELMLFLYFICQWHGVDVALPMAVMKHESNFVCGPLGRKGIFLGPGGIHKDFRSKWDIDDPKENIRVVVMSFEGCNTEPKIIARLKTYNKQWWKNNYLSDVMKSYRQYARNKRGKL